jgi:hypothetical protein
MKFLGRKIRKTKNISLASFINLKYFIGKKKGIGGRKEDKPQTQVTG